MKKLFKPLILAILWGMLSLTAKSQIVDKKYVIDTVWNYPDMTQEKFSISVANVTVIFTMDTIVRKSYLEMIYKNDTIHFVATGNLDAPASEDGRYYMERYTIMNISTARVYKLNLMFYTKNDALTAIGIVDGKSISVFSVKDDAPIKEINQ